MPGELAFEGVEDRLDGLVRHSEEPATGSFGFALRVRRDSWILTGDAGLEVATKIVLVRQQDLAFAWTLPGWGDRGTVEQDLTFVGFGAGQRVPDGQTVQGRDQVKA